MDTASLGVMIRKLRLQQRRTIKDIAAQCGFTPSLLSKIETGKTMPPISTLMKIADALGTKLSVLLDEGENTGTVFESSASIDDRMTITEKGYLFAALFQERSDKIFQPFLFSATRDEVQDKPLVHNGEEFIYMLEGEMQYRVGTEEYRLKPGDSLFFDSELEHDLVPLSGTVKYLVVFAERKKE